MLAIKRILLAIAVILIPSWASATVITGSFQGQILGNFGVGTQALDGTAIHGTFTYDTRLLGPAGLGYVAGYGLGIFSKPANGAISVSETFGGVTATYINVSRYLYLQHDAVTGGDDLAFLVQDRSTPYNGSEIVITVPAGAFRYPSPASAFDVYSNALLAAGSGMAYFNGEELFFTINHVDGRISVPEPSSCGMLACAIVLLGVARVSSRRLAARKT